MRSRTETHWMQDIIHMAEEAVSQEQEEEEEEDKESSILGTGVGATRRRRATGILYIRVQRSSVRVQRSSVDSALACCKADPSSNLGSAP
jgi:hypothetical protein